MTDEVADDITTYWRGKGSLPKLGKVEKRVLCVPATSTSSERSFSIAGRTVEERKTQLSSAFVDGLIFLHGLMFS